MLAYSLAQESSELLLLNAAVIAAFDIVLAFCTILQLGYTRISPLYRIGLHSVAWRLPLRSPALHVARQKHSSLKKQSAVTLGKACRNI